MKSRVSLVLLAAAIAVSTVSASLLNDPANRFEVRTGVEFGFVGVPAHTIQFGRDATKFDYVRDGSQNILFPFRRLSAELHLKPRHTIIFLIQPLDIRTETYLESPLVVDNDTFPAGTPMDLRYGFDFYRVSWQYDFWPDPERELAVGASLQVRDATISFSSKDGSRSRVYQDVGPVPVLRFRARVPAGERGWFGSEIDGFYAQGKFVTGSNNVESSFKGALLDASLRYGLSLNESVDAFLNARYVGGGAEGQQNVPENRGDGYTSNWLSAVSLSVGFFIK